MRKTPNDPPADFGHGGAPQGPPARPLVPPLATTRYVDDVAMYDFFQPYNPLPLTPVSRFGCQLVQICAALEHRIRELDPDA